LKQQHLKELALVVVAPAATAAASSAASQQSHSPGKGSPKKAGGIGGGGGGGGADTGNYPGAANANVGAGASSEANRALLVQIDGMRAEVRKMQEQHENERRMLQVL
jgi:hypothetical protein